MARYTAQEMRETAKDIEADLVFSPPSEMDDVMYRSMAMLRQAADELEREKKYEYAIKWEDGRIDGISLYKDNVEEAISFINADGLTVCHLVRRSVGEWEEVK